MRSRCNPFILSVQLELKIVGICGLSNGRCIIKTMGCGCVTPSGLGTDYVIRNLALLLLMC